MEPARAEEFDMLIVGAGLSGIDAAYRLQTDAPGNSYAILEARDRIGGTWDLFRYPGIRSDSDMYTLGFPFRPWPSEEGIAGGEAIRDYIEDTAREFGISDHIRFRQRVLSADWNSDDGRWTVMVRDDRTGKVEPLRCRFLYMGSGYYDYAAGYTPDWPDMDAFQGRIVHPQEWPDDLDYAGKRVVVIGSGATAVTLIPSLAEKAAHVTMLQRSPTYIVSRPRADGFAKWARGNLPSDWGSRAARWRSILLGMAFYNYARRRPEQVKRQIMAGARANLPAGYDVARDFEPSYNPWDQRLCLVPDADLFDAIGRGTASIVTDRIARFTPDGIALESGRVLDADIVVTATGLSMKLMGGVELSVDGEVVPVADRLVYKGMMLEGVPNCAMAFGYTNASWTLKCDLTARYACRLLNHMDRNGFAACTPVQGDPEVTPEPMLGFTSGYVKRAEPFLPKQGSKAPWRVHQNYLMDLSALKFGALDDGTMRFTRAGMAVAEPSDSHRRKARWPVVAAVATAGAGAVLAGRRARRAKG